MCLTKLAGVATLVALMTLAAGCERTPKGDPKNLTEKKGEDHPEVGPNGGPLAEWGDEEYHVEFVVKPETREASVYVLGSDAKTYKPIEAKEIEVVLDLKDPVTLKLEPHPLKTDAGGVASRFSTTHEVLGKKMRFSGTIKGKVGDTEYQGDFNKNDPK